MGKCSCLSKNMKVHARHLRQLKTRQSRRAEPPKKEEATLQGGVCSWKQRGHRGAGHALRARPHLKLCEQSAHPSNRGPDFKRTGAMPLGPLPR